MRMVLVIALGLASISALAGMKPAVATNFNVPKSCVADHHDCVLSIPDEPFCAQMEISCRQFNKERGFKDPSDPVPDGNDGPAAKPKGDAKGGGSKQKPGARRTSDGGIVMVTPEGKEWIWNGKYNSNIVVINRTGYQETITVMQGDPDVSLTKVVNGVRYNVASPAYAAALAAEQAKANGSKGVTHVEYHKPAGDISGGVTTAGAISAHPGAATVTMPGTVSDAKRSAVTNSGTISNSGAVVTNSGVISGQHGSVARRAVGGAASTTFKPQ